VDVAAICLLVVGPATIAILALVFAVQLAVPGRQKRASSGRMLGAYVLLLVAFGIGMCYAVMFTSLGHGTSPVLCAVGLFLLVGLTGIWLRRTWRLPHVDPQQQEGSDVPRAPDLRVWAMTLICLFGAAAAVALVAACFA